MAGFNIDNFLFRKQETKMYYIQTAIWLTFFTLNYLNNSTKLTFASYLQDMIVHKCKYNLPESDHS